MGDGAASHRLEEVLSMAQEVGADQTLIEKAAVLKSARQVAEKDADQREQRKKLEREADAERKGREARQEVIEKRRDAQMKEVDSRTRSELHKDQAADETLISQTAGSEKLLVGSIKSGKISKAISLTDHAWRQACARQGCVRSREGVVVGVGYVWFGRRCLLAWRSNL